MFAVPNQFFRGMIIIWKGAIADIPAGWGLCDGTRDTEDLRERFIICASASLVVDGTGGSATHEHTVAVEAHTHNIASGTEIAEGADFESETAAQDADGATNAVNHYPLYFVKAYIQKL